MHILNEEAQSQNNNDINFFHILTKGFSKFVTKAMLLSMFRYLYVYICVYVSIYVNTEIELQYTELTLVKT